MTSESLSWWSDTWALIAVLLTVLLAVVGALAWRFATWTTQSKDDELKKFQADSSLAIQKSQEATAEANARVQEAKLQIERIRIDQGPRAAKANMAWLGGNGGLPSVLKANPIGEAIIWYIPNDPEAAAFARELWFEMRESGWKMRGYEESIPSDVLSKEAEEMRRAKEEKIPAFSLVTIDGSAPLLVATSGGRNWNDPPTVPAKTLIEGLLKSGFSIVGGGNNNPLVPPGVVLIVVGQKQ